MEVGNAGSSTEQLKGIAHHLPLPCPPRMPVWHEDAAVPHRDLMLPHAKREEAASSPGLPTNPSSYQTSLMSLQELSRPTPGKVTDCPESLCLKIQALEVREAQSLRRSVAASGSRQNGVLLAKKRGQ